MSRSKEWFAGARPPSTSAGRGRRFTRCTCFFPCPVCGRTKLCSIGEFAILCTRVSEGAVRSGANSLGEFHTHRRTENERSLHIAPRRPEATAPRAAPAVCDRAYRTMLAELRLTDIDRASLRARGLDDPAIDAAGYRTLEPRGRARLARLIMDAVGDEHAPRIPGIRWNEEHGGRGWWSMCGSAGLLVPVRDLEGNVVALKVRRRDPLESGPRYLCLSSARHGGMGPASTVHVPVAALALRGQTHRLVITEGELKADVATALLRCPVVGIPGVAAWALGAELALRWDAPEVVVALDMDRTTNPRVAEANDRLVDALRGRHRRVSVWSWDPKAKGLDDILARIHRERFEQGIET